MQRTEKIDISKVEEVFESIFKEPVTVYQSDSDPETELLKFETKEQLNNHFISSIEKGNFSSNYAIYYLEAKGYFHHKKVVLNPEKCNGATYRFSASGWGVIHLQISLRNKPELEIRISVNSEKRASNWSGTHSELKSPDLWSWKFVEKQARRLIRVLKQCV